MYKKHMLNNSYYNDNNVPSIVIISAVYMYHTYYYIYWLTARVYTLRCGSEPCTVLTHIYAWSFASLDANDSGPDQGGGTGTGAGTCSLAHWTDAHCCCCNRCINVCVCVYCVLCVLTLQLYKLISRQRRADCLFLFEMLQNNCLQRVAALSGGNKYQTEETTDIEIDMYMQGQREKHRERDRCCQWVCNNIDS